MKATLSNAFKQIEAEGATDQQSAWSATMAEFWHRTRLGGILHEYNHAA
jgi:hypothetical protein